MMRKQINTDSAACYNYDIEDYNSFETAKAGCSDQDFIKPGFSLGSVGSRIAVSAQDKTWFSIQEAIAIATGTVFCNHQYKRGGLIYISAQEPKNEVKCRCKTISESLNLPPDISEMADKNLKFWHFYGKDPDLLESVDGVFLFEEGLTRFINKHQPFYLNDKLRLIVFDTDPTPFTIPVIS